MDNLSSFFKGTTRTLPNGGGSYSAPLYSPNKGYGAVDGAYTYGQSGWLKTPTQQQAPAPAPVATPEVDLYAKYRDPKTGNVMSPEEYALYLGNRVPQSGLDAEIPKYAGDAMTNPDESAESLMTRARNMNNSRNDIATGASDPYKVGANSGIAYSPQELAAIEKAYAGIYDPALNDVFARLKTKEEEKKREQDREDMIFATNENIRQWRATTGTTKDGNASDLFTPTQINDGASKAGMTITAFKDLDQDVQNFYINEPKGDDGTGKAVPIKTIFKDRIATAKTKAEIDALSEDISSSSLPESVKHHFISQLPLPEPEKEAWYKKIWGTVTGVFN
jgi:hypothetical protein